MNASAAAAQREKEGEHSEEWEEGNFTKGDKSVE